MIPEINKGYDFDSYLPTRYWNNKTRIEYIQRRIIVFSIMYYELSESPLDDKQYDSISYQLVEYMNTTPKEILEQTKYWYVFYDFDGTTGYYLPYRLTEEDKDYLYNIAQQIKTLYKSGGITNG
jgi:hypothetical protein